MNRTFLLLITCLTLHSTIVFADNWNAIFTILQKQGALGQNSAPTNTVRSWLGSLQNSPEGKITIDYVGAGAGAANSVAAKQYTDALAKFQNRGVTPPVTSTPTGDTVNANWDTAIAAFGSPQLVFNKDASIAKTMPTTIATTAAYYKDAQVVLQYLTGATLNATDATQLDAAFTRANVNRSTNTNTTLDTAAAALKAQIEAAKLVYNTYKPNTYTPTA